MPQLEIVRGHYSLDKTGIVFHIAEFRAAHDSGMKRDRRFNSGNVILVERQPHAIDRGCARGADRNYFRDHRIVIRRHDVASVSMRIYPNAAATGRVVKSDSSRGWLKIFGRILGVDATLDRVEPRGRVRDVWRERLTGGDPNLFLYQITTVNLFRDGVFNLDAGIHLDEIEMSIRIDEKLNRASILVGDGFREFDRGISHFLAQPRVHKRRRAFLDHFLVPPLNGIIPLAQMNNVAT